jgi:hypothetical protein
VAVRLVYIATAATAAAAATAAVVVSLCKFVSHGEILAAALVLLLRMFEHIL